MPCQLPHQNWHRRFKKLLQIVVALCLSLVVVVGYWKSDGTNPFGFGKVTSDYQQAQACLLDFDSLEHLNLSRTIRYARYRLVVDFSKETLPFTESLDQPSPLFESVDLYHDHGVSGGWAPTLSYCLDPVTVKVPKLGRPTDASHLIFGVATTAERLESSIGPIQHWLSNTKARLLALIPPNPDHGVLQEKMQSLGIDVTIYESDQSFDDRYFALVTLLYEHRQEDTRWAGLVDDDTFFLSMSQLVSRLADHNHEEEKYIGGLSEDFLQLAGWGFMAYGGAGVFISMPLLAKINTVYPECNSHSMNGDGRLAQCIYHHTTTKLTWEPDLHQMNLHGDPAGFYESGRQQPLSIHHWKSWSHIDVAKLSTVSSICGDACLLKRWRFSDSWFLINGYSFIRYAEEPPLDGSMEQTWDDYEGATADSYAHSLAPLRARDWMKLTYRLEDVTETRGEVRQFYVLRAGHGAEDGVIEVSWTRRT
ncbi:hypothetical protein MMC12_001475 [Toensbergia leucococca]|nr:hypothetical protein [Toensbergia leucococca]